MPPLPFIVERSYIRNEGEVSNDTPRILNQHQLLSAAREKVSHEQVLEWLETGKAKQRAYYAELIEDPAWQAMYERLSGKAPSTIPDDPVERKKWATDMAKKQGWL